jgi:acyl-CoA oxidase
MPSRTDAFQFAPEHLRAPIATGAERERQDEARDYYAKQKADGTAPVEEKALAKKTAITNKKAAVEVAAS